MSPTPRKQAQFPGCSQKGRGLLQCLRKDVSQLAGPFESGLRPSLPFTPCLPAEQGPQACTAQTELAGPAPSPCVPELVSDSAPQHPRHHCRVLQLKPRRPS